MYAFNKECVHFVRTVKKSLAHGIRVSETRKKLLKKMLFSALGTSDLSKIVYTKLGREWHPVSYNKTIVSVNITILGLTNPDVNLKRMHQFCIVCCYMTPIKDLL